MAYSIDASTDNCYPGTTCLINKFNIRNEEQLAEVESGIFLAKASLLDQTPIPGNFDFKHYREIHHFLFCDLYDWAGEIRTVTLSKKGTIFMAADEIESCAKACFSRLATTNFTLLRHHEVAVEIADSYHTVNILHPFREGNGRAQRIFFTQWIRRAGFDIDLSCVDTDLFMIATIHAAQGVLDDLISFFDSMLIEPGQTFDLNLSF